MKYSGPSTPRKALRRPWGPAQSAGIIVGQTTQKPDTRKGSSHRIHPIQKSESLFAVVTQQYPEIIQQPKKWPPHPTKSNVFANELHRTSSPILNRPLPIPVLTDRIHITKIRSRPNPSQTSRTEAHRPVPNS